LLVLLDMVIGATLVPFAQGRVRAGALCRRHKYAHACAQLANVSDGRAKRGAARCRIPAPALPHDPAAGRLRSPPHNVIDKL